MIINKINIKKKFITIRGEENEIINIAIIIDFSIMIKNLYVIIFNYLFSHSHHCYHRTVFNTFADLLTIPS